MKITDSHIHLWDPSHLNYAWLESLSVLNKTHLPVDLLEAAKPYELASAVFVQAECDPKQSLEEVSWVTELAKHHPNIKGIVAFAPLELGLSADLHLSYLKKNPLVKGVRRIIQFEKESEFCLQPDFVAGVQLLSHYDFPFDICIKTHQLPQVIELIKQCPDIKFMLDHVAKPNIESHELEPWKQHLHELAQFPNVWCKISGLVTEADHLTWQQHHLEPYITHAINVFGFDRLLFGSDWPVMNLATHYSRWIDTLREILKPHSQTDLQKFFHDNAQQFYGLNRPI